MIQPRSLLVLPLVALGLPGLARDGAQVDYPAVAAAFLAQSHVAPEGLTFQGLLDSEAFARFELGTYDVRIPVAGLTDATHADRLQEACGVLVEVQRAWSAWRAGGADAAAEAEWEELAKWIKSWSPHKLAACAGGERSLYEQLAAKDKVLEAAAHRGEALRYPEATVKLVGDKNVTVLLPSRELFLQVACAAGQLSEEARPGLWKDSLVRDGAAWAGWAQLIALEVAVPDSPDPNKGFDFSQLDRTALRQYVADRGATVLLRKEACTLGTSFFEQTLATDLVIAAVGVNGIFAFDWTVNYQKAGGSSQPYTRWVAGAGPIGGKLPPRKIQSGPTTYSSTMTEIGHYLATFGKEYFLEPLKDGQREGAKMAAKTKVPLATDKRPHFELHSLTANSSTVISAPFLGRIAEEKSLPPDEYLDDYEDFFRAYRACFVNWLRTKGAGADSPAKFAQLLARQASRRPGEVLDDVVQEVYGVPLSAPDDSTDNLEWRFLTWLPKGK